MTDDPDMARVAQQLRAEFDAGFAEAPAERTGELRAFLDIRVANQAFLVDLAEVSGVQADREIAPIPGMAPELLGLAGVHGEIVPVFALTGLLGIASGPERPRWLLLAGGSRPVGFAFDALVGYRGIAGSDIAEADADKRQLYVSAMARHEGMLRPLLDLKALSEGLAAR